MICLSKIKDKIRKKVLDILFKNFYSIEYISQAYASNFMYYSRHMPKSTKYLSIFEKAGEYQTNNDVENYRKLKNIILKRMDKKQIQRDMWQHFISKLSSNFYDLALRNEDERAVKMLNNMFGSNLCFGFEMIREQVEQIEKSPKYKIVFQTGYLSSMLSLAEYLGIIPVENLEQNC